MKRKKNAGRKLKKSRLDNNLCVYCGNLRENLNHKSCNKCKQIQKDKYQLVKLEVLKNYGGKCNCCGETEEAFLCIDHVNNDGKKHRKEIGKGYLYTWLKDHNFPKDNFQILCWNCNLAKFHKGICPH